MLLFPNHRYHNPHRVPKIHWSLQGDNIFGANNACSLSLIGDRRQFGWFFIHLTICISFGPSLITEKWNWLSPFRPFCVNKGLLRGSRFRICIAVGYACTVGTECTVGTVVHSVVSFFRFIRPGTIERTIHSFIWFWFTTQPSAKHSLTLKPFNIQ